MPRHRWKSNFTEDYAKYRSTFGKDYAERAEKTEASSMWREPEADYEMHVKPYKPDKAEKAPRDLDAELEKWDSEHPGLSDHLAKREHEEAKRAPEETPPEPERIEPEPAEPVSIAEQQKMYEQLLEPVESTPVEDLELEIKPTDYLEKPVESPVERPVDYAEPKKSDAEPRKADGY